MVGISSPDELLFTLLGYSAHQPLLVSDKSSSGDEIPERDVTYHLI